MSLVTRRAVIAVAVIIVTVAAVVAVKGWTGPGVADSMNNACRDHGGVLRSGGQRVVICADHTAKEY